MSKEDIENEEIQDTNQADQTDASEQEEVLPTTEELIAIEKDKYLRLFAEFENYKKRTSKERIELFKTANQELMTVLLPILDDFDRGLSEIKKVKDKNLLKGMELISAKFKSILTQKGLTQVEVKKGEIFDAEVHEAITQIPAPSPKLKGKIIEVIEQGYKLGDKIIRFPKVIIGH